MLQEQQGPWPDTEGILLLDRRVPGLGRTLHISVVGLLVWKRKRKRKEVRHGLGGAEPI